MPRTGIGNAKEPV